MEYTLTSVEMSATTSGNFFLFSRQHKDIDKSSKLLSIVNFNREGSLQTKQAPLCLLHVASKQFQHDGSDPIVAEDSDTYFGHAARQVVACKLGCLGGS